MKVIFHGTRGAYPINRPDSQQVGGLTNCVELVEGDNRLIIDAGSGITNCEPSNEFDFILLSHFHLDHVICLPEFLTRKKSGTAVLIAAGCPSPSHLKKVLNELFGSPYFPVALEVIHPAIEYADLGHKRLNQAWEIRHAPLTHPGGSSGYCVRSRATGKSVTHLMDHEHLQCNDDGPSKLAHEADLLIWDGCYDDIDYHSVRGFGHSTWEQGVLFGLLNHVKMVAISGHATHRTDARAAAIEKCLDPSQAILAKDGQILVL